MNAEGDVESWRQGQRARLIAARQALAPEDRARWQQAIERALAELVQALPDGMLGLYWPIKGEFDALALASSWLAQGRSLALPALPAAATPLQYRRWRPGEALLAGAHGIPMPAAPEIVHPSIVLVPLVGFDAANFRLGYGGGYFDRFLAAAVPPPTTIGIGFAFSELRSIYPQRHDRPMEIILTEAFQRARREAV